MVDGEVTLDWEEKFSELSQEESITEEIREPEQPRVSEVVEPVNPFQGLVMVATERYGGIVIAWKFVKEEEVEYYISDYVSRTQRG
jgi:hypothetical protein